jgi:GINS complex subunit 2
MGELLLEAASDDFEDAESVRKLLQGLREVRMAKLRNWTEKLNASSGIRMNGIGGMEVCEARPFVCGVVDGLRRFVATREEQNREQEGGYNGYGGAGAGRSSRTPYTQYTESTAGGGFDDDDDEMMDTQ